MIADRKENGTESLNWWWSNSEKADTQFSVPRVHCPEKYTSVLMVIRLNLFFAQLFLLISSVSTEQSQICVMKYSACHVRTGRLVLAGQSDPLFEPASLLTKTPSLRLKFLHKKIYCKNTKNEWKGYHNKIACFKFVLMQDSWQQLESDSTLWQRTLKNSHNLQNQWHVVSTFCQEMKNHLTQNFWFEGTPKLARVESHNQLLAR